MNKKLISILPILLLSMLSGLAALYGLGFSYHRTITPVTSLGEFQGIHGDSWLESGASIRLRRLAPRGNRLEITFGSWHPPGLPPAELRATVCGELAAFIRATPGSTQPVFLKGNCEPRLVEFEVLNPFAVSETDTRRLGAQIDKVHITSAAGIPLLHFELIIAASAAIFALALLVLIVFRASMLRWTAFAVPFLSCGFLASAHNLQLYKPYSLWCFAAALCAGAAAASFYRRRFVLIEAEPERLNEQSAGKGYAALAAIFGIMAAGAALRFYGIRFGLPENYHPDEVPKYNAIMRMTAHGDLNPRYFLHPSSLLYMTYFMNNLLHAFGFPGAWEESLILAGRVGSAIAGILSIYFIYAIGKRLYSTESGLFAAALLAIAPLHVTSSRYVKEDALLVCVTLLALLTVIKAVQEDRKLLLIFGGFLAGCSSGVKYSGMLSAAIIFAVPWLRSKKLVPDWTYAKLALAALAVFPLGFLVTTPYSVLDQAAFVRDFSHESNHMARGHTLTIDAWSQYWMYHFWRSIIPGMSTLSALLGIAGLGFCLWRRRMSDLFVVALFLLFYLPAEWVKAKPAPQPERYILPCLPILALAAAELLRQIRELRLKSVAYALGIAALVVPLYRTAQLTSEVSDDTRARMAAWMKENIPHGSKVYIDWKPYSPRMERLPFEPVYLPRSRIIPSLEMSELRSGEADYLLLSSLFYDRYFGPAPEAAALRDRIRQVFKRVPIVKEVRPRHGTYGFHNPTLTLFSLKEQDFLALERELAEQASGERDNTSNDARASFKWRLGR